MNTAFGPSRFLVLAVYAALVVVALVLVGCRVVPVSDVSPAGTPSRSADADPR